MESIIKNQLNRLTRTALFCSIGLSILFTPAICVSLECIEHQFLFEMRPDADQPSDIAVGPNGYIYLVDGVNNRIIVLDNRGTKKFAFGKAGAGMGQFNHPLGIDISDKGRVFVADTGNHRIQIFELDGKFLNMFPVGASAGEKPSDPVDVLASKLKGYVYVSDNDNHKIKVYDRSGKFQFEWGKFGEEFGEFRYPGILALNAYNEVLVVDVLNTRVQKFDPFGNFIAEIGGWGVRPGKLFRPKGVAIDKKNRVFISDSYMGVIQVYTDLGRFLGVVCENQQPRRFITPVGLLIHDDKNQLQVVEMKGNKISVLKMQN